MTENKKVPIISRFSERTQKDVEWLWPDKIPLGTISTLVGKRELGKSTLAFFIAAKVSCGGCWPELPGRPTPKGSVIILTTEDDIDRTIMARLKVAGADLSKIITVEGYRDSEGTKGLYNLTEDFDVLFNAVMAEKDVRLIILDPIPAFCGRKNENKNAEVRQFLAPLIKLAEHFNLSILGINHLNKDTSKEASHRVLGSVAWGNAIRSELMVVADKEDKERRLLMMSKASLTPNKTGLAFRLKSTAVTYNEKLQTFPLCCFDSGIVHTTPDDALYDDENKKNNSRKDEVKDWLLEFLDARERPAKEVFVAGKELGFSTTTINRAKKEMGINSKRSTEKNGGWEWSLFR